MNKLIAILLFSFMQFVLFSQTDNEGMYMDACIVIADTSSDYSFLHIKMIDLHKKLNLEIDTMGRGFDISKKIICLPADHEDEIYAGDYFPRRYLSLNLSLEYIDYYITGGKPEGGTIALVVEINENKQNAKLTLKKVSKVSENAFIIKSKIYMGCMH